MRWMNVSVLILLHMKLGKVPGDHKHPLSILFSGLCSSKSLSLSTLPCSSRWSQLPLGCQLLSAICQALPSLYSYRLALPSESQTPKSRCLRGCFSGCFCRYFRLSQPNLNSFTSLPTLCWPPALSLFLFFLLWWSINSKWQHYLVSWTSLMYPQHIAHCLVPSRHSVFVEQTNPVHSDAQISWKWKCDGYI